MKKINERYSVARNTSNLKSVPKTTFSASDVLGAAGMARQVREDTAAMILWEVNFKGKAQAKMELVDILSKQLAFHMLRNRSQGDSRKIAIEVVSWWLYGTCKPCGGLGYEQISGAPTLSARVCKSCRGTKKVPLPRTPAHDWLHDRLSLLQSIAGGRVMRKISAGLSDFS